MSAERFVRHRWMDFDEYERKERIEYAALATTVAAIGVEAGYRLQHVEERANQPTSLRKKIEQRGIAAMTTF